MFDVALLGGRLARVARWVMSRPETARYRLVVVPGVTHLFEEPGPPERVGHEAVEWFDRHLSAPASPREPVLSARSV